MNKNAYAAKLMANRERREMEAYNRGKNDGIDFALNLVTIALNDLYSFGADRIKRLEAYMGELAQEIVDTGDPEVNNAHIEQRIKQIRGQDYQVWEEHR